MDNLEVGRKYHESHNLSKVLGQWTKFYSQARYSQLS